MSLFRQLAQSRMNPALDSHFGEVVHVRGMRTRPNFPAERDPEREIVEAVAIFADRAALWGGNAPDNAGKRRVPFERERSEVLFRLSGTDLETRRPDPPLR
jgi:hypothetical protein